MNGAAFACFAFAIAVSAGIGGYCFGRFHAGLRESRQAARTEPAKGAAA